MSSRSHRIALARAAAAALLAASWAGTALAQAGPGPFDGVYRGQTTPRPGSNPGCFGVSKVVRVTGGRLLGVLYYARFSLPLAPDGTMQGTSMQTYMPRGVQRPVRLRGRADGRTLTLDFSTSTCQFHALLTKQ